MLRSRPSPLGVSAAFAAFAVFAATLAVATGSRAEDPPARPARPNLVLILTDDLSGRFMDYLPRLRGMLGERGLELGMVTTTPLCAPSRASILTGEYAHHHGLLVNSVAGFHRAGGEEDTFATWLRSAGYTTGYFGKYINGYGLPKLAYVPTGWDRWLSGIRMSGRFAFETIVEDGSRAAVRDRYDVDVYAEAAARFVATAPEPFVAVWAPLSPHGPFVAAPRHRGGFDDVAIDWPESFAGDQEETARLLRTRLEMMLAVEEGVAAILEALEKRGALDDTYVFFTSDNGVFMGEHGLAAGKGQPYEESSRVPLYVRGPGVRVGRSDALVTTQDIAPTFAELAGLPVPPGRDGRSLVPLFAGEPEDWRERVLLEFWTMRGGGWRGLRTRDAKYARWSDGKCVVFDLEDDPHELRPLPCDADAAAFERWVEGLSRCAGAACAQLEDEAPARLSSPEPEPLWCRAPVAAGHARRATGSGAAPPPA